MWSRLNFCDCSSVTYYFAVRKHKVRERIPKSLYNEKYYFEYCQVVWLTLLLFANTFYVKNANRIESHPKKSILTADFWLWRLSIRFQLYCYLFCCRNGTDMFWSTPSNAELSGNGDGWLKTVSIFNIKSICKE